MGISLSKGRTSGHGFGDNRNAVVNEGLSNMRWVGALFLREDRLDELAPTASGVYVIFANDGQVLYVGQSDNVQRRLNEHLATGLYPAGTLWIALRLGLQTNLDGVERYMANRWWPKHGSAWPDVTPIVPPTP